MPGGPIARTAQTSLEAAREPAPVLTSAVPVHARTAPVAVAGLATGLRRQAAVGARAARPAAHGLAPLRRQAARVGTVRRMQAATDVTASEPTPLPKGLHFSVALDRGERSKRDVDVSNAGEHARYDAEQAKLNPEEVTKQVKAAEALAKAAHVKDPAPFEAHRSQPVKEAWLSGANGAITSHWELMLRYGDDHPQQWVKIDLTSADGYRVIWATEPRNLLTPLKVKGTVGEVLVLAGSVADRHATYFNPDRPDADLSAPRYSCQHFVAEIAAVYGDTLTPVVKK